MADLLSARVLVWIASVGRNGSLTRDTHLDFFDRYSRLARYHRARGPGACSRCWPRHRTQTSFAVGCYCADEARCQRSVLRGLLAEHGARIV